MANAVLVIDTLRGFLEPGYPLFCGEEARKTIPSVQSLLERELARGSRAFFICDTHSPDDPEFQMFPPHCISGTVESEIVPELASYPGVRLDKQRYSAFYGTELDRMLQDVRADRLTLCGVCTDICVLHTAADARNRLYPVEVPIDCVASFDPEAHRWALKHMEKILGVQLVTRTGQAAAGSP
ncbi:MAG: cysteine hydrolase [Chloroflexi bacterium]|nr:cysteine hydrolase [Chloroflexota bacterium]